MNEKFDTRKDPVIRITEPVKTTTKIGDFGSVDYYDYSNSHVIYMGMDLGSFEELKVMKEEVEKNKQLKASVKYYVDILTDLKKWLEEVYDYTNCVSIHHVLNKIKELENQYNVLDK